MSKQKIEDIFNLAPEEPVAETEAEVVEQDVHHEIQTLEDALSVSEKINLALAEVRNLDAHDEDMDEIAREALASYKDLMEIGVESTDMAAGSIFSNAAAMLKIALEAKDSKVTRKLKQIDLMLKKERLDRTKSNLPDPETDDTGNKNQVWDRNELLRLLKENK